MANSDDDVICISDSDNDDDVRVPSAPVNATIETAAANDRIAVNNNGENECDALSACTNNNSKSAPVENDAINHQPSSSAKADSSNGSSATIKFQEIIDLDDEIDELLQVKIPKLPPNGKDMAESALEDLMFKLKATELQFSLKERARIKGKLWDRLGKIDLGSNDIAFQVADYIRELIKTITAKPKIKWSKIHALIAFLDSKNKKLTKGKAKSSTETPEERVARKKQEKIELVEKRLKKMEKAIEKWDHLEVDLDDERNSAYLVKTRMVNEYMKHYKTLCRETGSTYYTGRPIEKRLKLNKITRFPEINEAVEKFLNSKSVLYVPDFKNIYDIVAKVNDTSRPPLLCKEPDEVHSTALCIFTQVMKILQRRRGQDLQIVVPLREIIDDPADHDPELQKKLEENKHVAESESQVLESFVKQQEEQKVAATEVMDENPDESAGESDDEDEEDDLSAEGVSNDVDGNDSSDSAGEGNKELEYTRDQVDEDDDDDDDEDVSKNDNVTRIPIVDDIEVDITAKTTTSGELNTEEQEEAGIGVGECTGCTSEDAQSTNAEKDDVGVNRKTGDGSHDDNDEEPSSKRLRRDDSTD